MSKYQAHFICQDGTERPADIEHIWNEKTGVANLAVLSQEYKEYMFPVTSIPYSAEQKPRTWHWAIACEVSA